MAGCHCTAAGRQVLPTHFLEARDLYHAAVFTNAVWHGREDADVVLLDSTLHRGEPHSRFMVRRFGDREPIECRRVSIPY